MLAVGDGSADEGGLFAFVWLGLPALYSGVCWLVLVEPAAVRARLPEAPEKMWRMLGIVVGREAAEVEAGGHTPGLWSLVPRSVPSAFALGRAVERRDEVEASRLLGGVDLSKSDLPRVAEAVAQFAERGSPLRNFLGLLSFVNVVAVLALLGIAVSLGPACAKLFGPVLKWLAPVLKWLGPVVARVASFVSDPLFFGVASYCVCESTRASLPPFAARQVAAFSSLVAAPSALVWTLRRPRRCPFVDQKGHGPVVELVATWLASYLAPVAVAAQSKLLGFFAVAAVYADLGFVVYPFFFGYFVGFLSEPAITRCEVTSVLLLSAYAATRKTLPERVAVPFRSAVAVFGTIALGMAELIASNLYFIKEENHPHRSLFTRKYYLRNLLSIALLTTAMAAGHLVPSPAIANTSLVFFVLWAVEKLLEFAASTAFFLWPCVLLVSIYLWWASLWLRAHDDFLPSLFAL
mmetsp:Transcript_17130/g.55659  ORF Transcript_17130/g.55659 Transcript_17130/m.55659 type:complete len:464 (-) Transcript_17130:875-2266(-)